MSEAPRILVVEDDPALQEIMCVSLNHAGFDALAVGDGLRAIQTFDAWEPALVTLDLMVPSISGFRLVELFKRGSPQTPVIVLTALDFEEATDVVHAGVDDFLTKPFDPQQLLEKIRYHLHRGSPRRFDHGARLWTPADEAGSRQESRVSNYG